MERRWGGGRKGGGGVEAMDKDEDRKLMLPNFRRRSTSNRANRVGGGSARAAADNGD